MLGRIDEALTRRRLGGAVLLLLGITVAAFVLSRGGEEAAPKPERLAVRIVSVPPLGLGFVHPTTWKRTVRKRVIALRSPEGSVLMYLSSPVRGSERLRVKAAAERELRRQFAPARVVRERAARLGVRTASSFELKGHDRKATVRAVVLVASTPYRTYAVTVLTGARPSRRRVREAQRILATVRFSKPKALRSKR